MARKKTVSSTENVAVEQQPEQQEASPDIKQRIWRAWMTSRYAMVAIFLALFLAASTGIFYFFRHIGTLTTDPQEAVAEEKRHIIAAVGKLMFLPEGEEPTVAEVTDLAQLQSQPFFDRATLGDKVLIYTNARKAILYNPDKNKIVDVTPLDMGDQGQ